MVCLQNKFMRKFVRGREGCTYLIKKWLNL